MTTDHKPQAGTLAEFLLARIAEDEAVAKAAAAAESADWMSSHGEPVGTRWYSKDDWGMVYNADTIPADPEVADPVPLWDDEGADRLCADPRVAEHFARHDPARVLAECEAKRRIVELLAEVPDLDYAVRLLALPYADHPDYREEWKP